jgi:hypothetical protein
VVPPPPSFDVADLLREGEPAVVALRGHTVIVHGMISERGHLLGSDYIVLGRGTRRVVQCFLADSNVARAAPGTEGRFSARILGVSLGTVLQADNCVAIRE